VIEAQKIILNIEDNQMLANILNTTMPGIIDDSFQTQESVIYDYQNIQEQNNTFAKEIHNLTALNLKQE